MALSKVRPINLYRLSKITETTQSTIDFCKDIGLIPKEVKCPNCGDNLDKPYFIKNRATTQIRYQCNKRQCRGQGKKNSISLKGRNWFNQSHISMKKSLFMVYSFVHQLSYKDAIRETSIDCKDDNGVLDVVTTSRETIMDYKRYCREVCLEIVEEESHNQIGGPGLEVEIDESKFGKRKYQRGRLVDGQWVFGGICRQTREFFLTTVKTRDKKTLIPIIQDRIRAGSTIYSDCWSSYKCLKNYNFTHKTVNHSQNFVDPITGAHTQNVENMWWQVKRTLPETHSNRDQLYLHLAEYMWRNSKCKQADLFIEFLKDAAKFVSFISSEMLVFCGIFNSKMGLFLYFTDVLDML